MSEMDDELRADCRRIQEAVASVNKEAASAVERATDLSWRTGPAMGLRNTHGELLDTLQATLRAIDSVEQQIDSLDHEYRDPTPRQITNEHADRLKEQYEGPVLNLALMLLDHNRRKWLQRQPESNGAQGVERHGLTENQRWWLNDLQEAWREYDGDE